MEATMNRLVITTEMSLPPGIDLNIINEIAEGMKSRLEASGRAINIPTTVTFSFEDDEDEDEDCNSKWMWMEKAA